MYPHPEGTHGNGDREGANHFLAGLVDWPPSKVSAKIVLAAQGCATLVLGLP